MGQFCFFIFLLSHLSFFPPYFPLSLSSLSPGNILGVRLDFSQQCSICDKLPFKGLLHYWWDQMCWLSLHTLVSLPLCFLAPPDHFVICLDSLTAHLVLLLTAIFHSVLPFSGQVHTILIGWLNVNNWMWFIINIIKCGHWDHTCVHLNLTTATYYQKSGNKNKSSEMLKELMMAAWLSIRRARVLWK